MALIAIASDKGAPGVTTAALALAAVWPRPVLLAECDPAGGDLVYRFPAAGGGRLDPRRGVLSLAVVARRGMQPQQVWEHAQKLHGGLDVLAGVTNAEQGAGLSLLWGPIGKVLAALPQADVIADCGRLGADGPLYDLLAEATTVVLVTKVQVADVIRLRDRATAFAAAAERRGRRGFSVGVVVVADHKKFRAALGEVQHVLGQAHTPATMVGGIAQDSKGADLLSGEWGGNLDRTLLIKTAREVAQHLLHGLPPIASPDNSPAASSAPAPAPAYAAPPAAMPSPPVPPPVMAPPVMSPPVMPPPVMSPPVMPSAAASPAAAVPPPADPPAADRPAASSSRGGPRGAFGRVLGGRSGKHQADPGQPVYVSAPVPGPQPGDPGQGRHAQGSSRPALSGPALSGPVPSGPALSGPAPSGSALSGPAASGPAPSGPAYTRTPMHPLTSAGPAQEPVQEDLAVQEAPVDSEDAAWGSSRWQRSPGSSHSGGG
jgi:MinD-like ATPase involved in chromosome partitioning or flagellar assembly